MRVSTSDDLLVDDIVNRPSRCPSCGGLIDPAPSAELSETTCPGCDYALWYVRMGPTSLLFDKETLTAEQLRAVAQNVPNEFDDFLSVIEKLMVLEDLCCN